LALEQCHQEQNENGGGEQKRWTYIHWNHYRARDAVQEDYWGLLLYFNDRMFE